MSDTLAERWGLFEQDIWDAPYELYAQVRSEAPVQPVTLYNGRAGFLVTGYDAARAALSDSRLSRDVVRDGQLRPELPPMYPPMLAKRHMLNTDPPDHSRLRGLVNRAFTPRRVEGLRSHIQDLTDGLLAGMPTAGKVELIESFAFPLPIAVIFELLGVPFEGAGELREAFARFLTSAYFPDRATEAQAALDQIDAFMMRLIEAKRRQPGDDLLSALVAARDDEWPKMDEEELLGTTFLLVIAGHETTVNLISNAVVGLLRAPDQLDALRADPGLISGAVHEFLRFDGPLQAATSRVATVDLELGGVAVPEGSLVVIQLAAANRDPAHFADPDRLDVSRPEVGHLGLGHGIHYCLGAPLALLEAEIAIGSLIRHYRTLRLAVDPSELHWRRSVTIRALQELPVEVATGN